MLQSIGYAVAYTGVDIAVLIVGFFALDLLTPGHLGRHIVENRSVNAALVLAAGFLGQGAIARSGPDTAGPLLASNVSEDVREHPLGRSERNSP